MMNKEERDAIRARCDAATPGEWHFVNGYEINERLMRTNENGALVGERPNGIAEIYPINRQANAEFIANARQDIPALLAALDEAEDRACARVVKELANQAEFYDSGIGEIQAERDKWKARTEALESFIRNNNTLMCCSCVSVPEKCVGNDSRNCSSWQFDEARFTGGD